MTPEIVLINASELAHRLEQLGRGAYVKSVLEALALYLKGKVSQYPPRQSLTRQQVYGQTWKSVKQRRWFFAALRRGAIDIPYRRGQSAQSENLGQSWTISVSKNQARIGTRVSYAPWVQSRAKQTKFMRAMGWQTVEDVKDTESETIANEAERLLQLEIKKLGL